MEFSKYVLYYMEYNGKGESLDIDSWDDRSLCFETEEELKEYVSKQPSWSFRAKAVYRLDNSILSQQIAVFMEDVMEDKYKVLYKGFSGGFNLSDDMSLEEARNFKEKCLSMGYPTVYIIQVIE